MILVHCVSAHFFFRKVAFSSGVSVTTFAAERLPLCFVELCFFTRYVQEVRLCSSVVQGDGGFFASDNAPTTCLLKGMRSAASSVDFLSWICGPVRLFASVLVFLTHGRAR